MMPIFLLACSVCLSIFYTLTFDVIPDTYNFIPKSLSILLLAGFFATRTQKIKGFTLIIYALLASAVGDIFLTFEHNAYFLYGLTSFLIAHIFYICAFWMRVQKPLELTTLQKTTIIFFVLIAFVNMAVLNSHLTSQFKWPVYAYMCVITIMICTASAIRPFPSLIFIGAVSFGLSDSLLSMQTFVTPYPASAYLIWFFYYSAQVFIVSADR